MTAEMEAWGLAGRTITVIGAGIVALGILNAGLMLRWRWLSLCGVAALLGFLAMLVDAVMIAP
jgi:hypothetical protein